VPGGDALDVRPAAGERHLKEIPGELSGPGSRRGHAAKARQPARDIHGRDVPSQRRLLGDQAPPPRHCRLASARRTWLSGKSAGSGGTTVPVHGDGHIVAAVVVRAGGQPARASTSCNLGSVMRPGEQLEEAGYWGTRVYGHRAGTWRSAARRIRGSAPQVSRSAGCTGVRASAYRPAATSRHSSRARSGSIAVAAASARVACAWARIARAVCVWLDKPGAASISARISSALP
jgi:hypothetical protein